LMKKIKSVRGGPKTNPCRFSLRKAMVCLHQRTILISILRRMCLWEIKKFADFRNYVSGDSSTNHHVKLNFLLQVSNDGEANESFRFTLDGHPLLADVWGKDIFSAPSLKDVKFRYEIDSKDLEFKANSFTSRWEDVEEMLAKKTIYAYNGSDEDDISTDIRKFLREEREKDKDKGAALRWAIQAKGQDSMKIVLQGLPLPANRIRKDARLVADDGPTIVLETINLKTTFTEEGACKGPQPILFARDPVLVRKTLSENPEKVHKGKPNVTHKKFLC
jgi:hypothetical protein